MNKDSTPEENALALKIIQAWLQDERWLKMPTPGFWAEVAARAVLSEIQEHPVRYFGEVPL